jgi:hypothetical protein
MMSVAASDEEPTSISKGLPSGLGENPLEESKLGIPMG